MVKLKTFQKELEERLKAANVEEAKLKVQLALSHILKVKILDLVFLDNITLKNKRKALKMVSKLEKHMPLQHLIKHVEFLNLKLYVNKHVLIPRNETELLADIIIKEVNKNNTANSLQLLDICCGSGALGLSVAKNTNAKVTVSDISKKALNVLKRNAKNSNLNVKEIHSDMFKNINTKYNLIISNPPYIKTEDINKLNKTVKNFEPHLALNGGKDGLEFYKIIANDAPKHLVAQGELFLEFGIGQEKEIKKLLQKHFTDIKIIKDYNDINRFIYAKLKGEQ